MVQMETSGEEKPKERLASVRALQFTPPQAEPGLITSSVRKKKRDPKSMASPTAKRLHLDDLPAPAGPPEALQSPELRHAKKHAGAEASAVQADQQQETGPASGKGQPVREMDEQARMEAATANPPRPPPDLPAGIPAPPIPQGKAIKPSPDHGHLPPGSKPGKGPKGVLQTIFSPMFHLFQPGDKHSKDSAEGTKHGKPSLRPGGAQLRSEQLSQQAQPSTAQASRTPSPPKGSTDAPLPDPTRRSRSPDIGHITENHSSDPENVAPPVEGPSGHAAKEGEPETQHGSQAVAGKSGRRSSTRGSESGSSTDGESDTCLGSRPLSTLDSRREGECSEDEEGDEVYQGGDDMDEDSLEFDPYAFIKSLPPLEQCAPAWRRCLLPRQTRRCKRKTLVLDLDETLVHSTLDEHHNPDFTFSVSFNNREHSVNVRQRPHLANFLERCAALFEVVIFTASQKLYAEQLLNILDPKRRLIRHRIFRDSCVLVDGNYLKDLSVLGRDLAQTIIVDNSPQAFGFQLANGVPIESWYDDDTDCELMRLLPFLESLVDVPDVRPVIINAFKLHQLVASAPDF